MRPLPPWRSDLEAHVKDDGSVEVRDPRLLEVYRLAQADYLIATLFDGVRDAAAIASELNGMGLKVDPRQILEIAAEYEAIHLLDTPASRAAAPVETIMPWSQLQPTKKKLRVLPVAEPDTRWACHHCGACCHGLAVEISTAEEKRIDASLYRDVIGDGEFWEEGFLDPDRPAQRVLKRRPDRTCIFLADNRCLVHQRQGMEAKPDACQLYPFVVVQVPSGPPRLGTRVNCETMSETFVDGPLLSTYAAEAKVLATRMGSHRVERELLWFGKLVGFAKVDAIFEGIRERLAHEGLDAMVAIDQEHAAGRARGSRAAFGRGLLEYLRKEADDPIPLDQGGYGPQVDRLPKGRAALEAMAGDQPPPSVRALVASFLVRQTRNVLYLGGPANLPDAGMGLVTLILGLEAAIHAIGADGDLPLANLAFQVFTAPLLETTSHAWPILDAIDPSYADRLRKEL